jgi:hypothetical protein
MENERVYNRLARWAHEADGAFATAVSQAYAARHEARFAGTLLSMPKSVRGTGTDNDKKKRRRLLLTTEIVPVLGLQWHDVPHELQLKIIEDFLADAEADEALTLALNVVLRVNHAMRALTLPLLGTGTRHLYDSHDIWQGLGAVGSESLFVLWTPEFMPTLDVFRDFTRMALRHKHLDFLLYAYHWVLALPQTGQIVRSQLKSQIVMQAFAAGLQDPTLETLEWAVQVGVRHVYYRDWWAQRMRQGGALAIYHFLNEQLDTNHSMPVEPMQIKWLFYHGFYVSSANVLPYCGSRARWAGMAAIFGNSTLEVAVSTSLAPLFACVTLWGAFDAVEMLRLMYHLSTKANVPIGTEYERLMAMEPHLRDAVVGLARDEFSVITDWLLALTQIANAANAWRDMSYVFLVADMAVPDSHVFERYVAVAPPSGDYDDYDQLLVQYVHDDVLAMTAPELLAFGRKFYTRPEHTAYARALYAALLRFAPQGIQLDYRDTLASLLPVTLVDNGTMLLDLLVRMRRERLHHDTVALVNAFLAEIEQRIQEPPALVHGTREDHKDFFAIRSTFVARLQRFIDIVKEDMRRLFT